VSRRVVVDIDVTTRVTLLMGGGDTGGQGQEDDRSEGREKRTRRSENWEFSYRVIDDQAVLPGPVFLASSS
jgi:hypothetical protein